MDRYDVIVIGGGPAGTTAALYTSRSNLKTLVIDKSVASGALGITSQIANFPGIPEVISGEELVKRMWKQAELYGATFKKARVVGVEVGDPKIVTTAEAEQFEARALIVATGAMGRTKTLAGEDTFLGRGVSYCATCDGAFFKDKDVALLGHNAEAVDEALFLTRFVKTLFVVTPKPNLQAPEDQVRSLLSKPQVKPMFGRRAVEVVGDGTVAGLKLEPGEVLPVRGVFVFTQGNRPIVDYLKEQVEVTENGCVPASARMETPIPGVFACGDILCNEVQQAVVASAQGCIAALSADRFLNKRKAFVKDYR
ncbi:MAG: FAD-dependent oxidoreductase [Planctomycetes bacterium]|nr:FAD-dependent oxidoreductase [Planctomycetota bacterium]